MSLRYICLEIRENLRCSNVFLQFWSGIIEKESLKIQISKEELRLSRREKEICVPVGDYVTLQENDVSNLTIEQINVCFRLLIEKFKYENKELTGTKLKALYAQKPRLEEGAEVAIQCENCECELIQLQKFERLREYPTGAIDTSEFFCHAHTDLKNVLVPKAGDIFYGFLHIVVNVELLKDTTKEKEGHIYCRRCLQYLGNTLSKGQSALLWTDAIKLRHEASEVADQIFDLVTASASAQLLYKIVRECTDSTQPWLLQMPMCRAVLIATFPNRQSKFLLLHILEKDLNVLRNGKELDEKQIDNNNVHVVRLGHYKAFKLLYLPFDERKVEREETKESEAAREGNDEILEKWLSDLTILSLKVSSKFYSEFLAELEENSHILPEKFRWHNNFNLSYIFYSN